MKCGTCGFATSFPTVSRCPFCNGALAGVSVSPLACVQQKYSLSAAEAYERQQQVGVLMVLSACACVLLGFFLFGFLPDPYARYFCAGLLILSLPLYLRGFGHCAQSKGYSWLIGWLLSILSFMGALILWRLSDKTKMRA